MTTLFSIFETNTRHTFTLYYNSDPNVRRAGSKTILCSGQTCDTEANTALTITLNVGDPLVAHDIHTTVPFNSTDNNVEPDLSGVSPRNVTVTRQPTHGKVTTTGRASSTIFLYTPTKGYHGTDSFEYTATNRHGSSTATVTITVLAPVITGSPTALPAGTFGQGYSVNLSTQGGISGGTNPYTFDIIPASGSLPPGLSPAANGTLSGTPTATGSYSFTVKGTDSSDPKVRFTSGTLNLTVQAIAPGAPTNVIATAGDGQATVSFTAPGSDGGSAITGYTVTASPGGQTATGARSPLTVKGLSNDTAYTFTVTATNAQGDGPASATSNSATPKLAVPVAGAVSARVDFGSRDNEIKPILSGGTAASVTVDTTNTTGTVTTKGSGKDTYFLYSPKPGFTGPDSFTYSATNAAGTSKPATVTITVQAIAPGAPTNVIATAGDGQATVSFDVPASDGGSQITGYKVKVYNGDTVEKTVEKKVGSVTISDNNVTVDITGLTNGTAYTFTVTATNAQGDGPESAKSNAVTPGATRPDPTRDPDVRGIVTAQNRMAQQFAHAQIDNVSQHLESLHGGDLHDHFGASLDLPVPRRTNRPDETGRGETDGARDTSDTDTNRPGRRYALWTAGSLSLLDEDRIDIHSDGLSAGIDYQIAPRAIVGVALGVGYGHADIGDDGSRTWGRSANGVVYGTLQAGKTGFVDVLAGYDALSFEQRRVIADGGAGGGSMAIGSRDGAQVFGQISAGMEYRTAQWMLSPYMRLRAISGHLDAFGEDTAAADHDKALHFDRQGFGSTRIDLGLRGSITRKVSFGDLFGTVTPNFRMEYHHFFNRDIAAGMRYADLIDRRRYVLTLPGAGENQMTLGLGVDVAFDGGMRMSLGYGNTFGDGTHRQSLVLRIGLHRALPMR